MSAPKLTAAQVRGLEVLARAADLGRLAERGRESSATRPWNVTINGRVANALEKIGYARCRCILAGGETEVHGADLGRYFGLWVPKFEITDAGRAALEVAS